MATMAVNSFELSNGLRFSGGRVGKELSYLGTNRPAAELAPLSLTHGDQSALYFAGLCDKYGIETGLDKKTKQACRAHYDSVHDNKEKGNWNNDAVFYDVELNDLGLYVLLGVTVQHDSIVVPWVVRPEWDSGIPRIGKKSKAVIAIMPPSGYGLIHLRDPNTGWVLQTRGSKAEAETAVAQDFAKFIGDSKASDLAREEVSYSCRRQKNKGKGVVCRGFSLLDDGPFCEFAHWGGGGRVGGLGSFSLE